jgi:hypothetical protein
MQRQGMLQMEKENQGHPHSNKMAHLETMTRQPWSRKMTIFQGKFARKKVLLQDNFPHQASILESSRLRVMIFRGLVFAST